MISVIVPTYNEEKLLEQTLSRLSKLNPDEFEVIVADGGSSDRTLSIAQSHKCSIVRCASKGRACQMNEAVRHSKGIYLVFLHADTFIPENSLSKVRHYLKDEKLALGGFTSIMKGSKVQWFISSQNYIKTYIVAFLHRPWSFLRKNYRMIFGDQVMFCRKADFERVGGFNENYLLMEDAQLCVSLNKLGKIRQFNDKVYSSDRRVIHWGLFSAYLRYLKILFWYVFIGNPSGFLDEYDDGR